MNNLPMNEICFVFKPNTGECDFHRLTISGEHTYFNFSHMAGLNYDSELKLKEEYKRKYENTIKVLLRCMGISGTNVIGWYNLDTKTLEIRKDW